MSLVTAANSFLIHPHSSTKSRGRNGHDDKALLKWHPKSLDMTPCDFFLWGFIKDKVFVSPLHLKIWWNGDAGSEMSLLPLQEAC
ncbi:hypothetical protein TNCV_2267311 [Trichonephila clavipes]|nr:hypothetical protein TNCV_2267311 [Trichonephila clavipes]